MKLISVFLILFFVSVAKSQDNLDSLRERRAKLEAELKAVDAQIEKEVYRSMDRDPPLVVQAAPVEKKEKSFFEKYVQIRENLQDPQKVSKPAIFSYTQPAGMADSYLIDAAIGVNIADALNIGHRVELTPYFEYHYNNLTDSPSDTMLLGVAPVWASPHDPTQDDFFYLIKGSAAWKSDELVNGEGFLGHVVFSPYFADLAMGAVKGRKSLMAFQWQVFAGLQAQTGNGASNAFADGEMYSVKAGIDAVAYPLPEFFEERLSLTGSIGYWNHFSRSGLFNAYDQSQDYTTISLDYALDEDEHFKIGTQYRFGDNPEQSKFDDSTWLFGFKVFY